MAIRTEQQADTCPVVAEDMYLKGKVGVMTVNRLFESDAKQLRTNSDIDTFILLNGTNSFVEMVEKGTWVTIINYTKSSTYEFPNQVVCITNNGESFNVNNETLISCFDLVGYEVPDSDLE